MNNQKRKIDFMNLPFRFRKAIISKCSLVSWSRLMRTSKHIDKCHFSSNKSLHLYDNRVLWCINDIWFLRNPNLFNVPSFEEVLAARQFKNEQLTAITIHVPRICMKIKMREYCFSLVSKISSLGVRTEIVHIWEYPKIELPQMENFINICEASSLWTGINFTAQKSLLCMPVISKMNYLYLPNTRIDGKTFLQLRNPVIDVDATNISGLSLLQWFKEIRNGYRIIRYTKFNRLSRRKCDVLLRKFGSETALDWKYNNFNIENSYKRCAWFAANCRLYQSEDINKRQLYYFVLDDFFLNELHVSILTESPDIRVDY